MLTGVLRHARPVNPHIDDVVLRCRLHQLLEPHELRVRERGEARLAGGRLGGAPAPRQHRRRVPNRL
eukprot:7942945-Pyramimonas_sp.AAC.1